jgi:protein-tyrosine-phosphatase
VDHVHIENFDYVLPMADVVLEDLKERFPALDAKLLPSWGIDDPYGGDLWTYEVTADRLLKHMEELSSFLKKQNR